MNTAQAIGTPAAAHEKGGKKAIPAGTSMSTVPVMGFMGILAQLVQQPQAGAKGTKGALVTKESVPHTKGTTGTKESMSHTKGTTATKESMPQIMGASSGGQRAATLADHPLASNGQAGKTPISPSPLQQSPASHKAVRTVNPVGTTGQEKTRVAAKSVAQSIMQAADKTGGTHHQVARVAIAPQVGNARSPRPVPTTPSHIFAANGSHAPTKTVGTLAAQPGLGVQAQDHKAALLKGSTQVTVRRAFAAPSSQMTQAQVISQTMKPSTEALSAQPVAPIVAQPLLKASVSANDSGSSAQFRAAHKPEAKGVLPQPTMHAVAPRGVALVTGVKSKSYHLQPLYSSQNGNLAQLPNPTVPVQGLSFSQHLTSTSTAQASGFGQTASPPVWSLNQSNHTEMFAQMVLHQTQNGVTQLKVHVHPEGLGNIVIAVSRHGEGVQVHVEANVMQTMQMLTHQTEQLMSAIRNTGVAVSGMQVSLGNAVLGDGNSQQHASKRQKQESSPSAGRSLAIQASGREQHRSLLPTGDVPSQALSIQV